MSSARPAFESLLTAACGRLTEALRDAAGPRGSSEFQDAVGEALAEASAGTGFALDGQDHPHVFPDFALGEFGVEVKFTLNDTWRSVANSVFEGRRSAAVKHVYIVFGKLGGVPEARFARYDDCIVHVRTSHVPRFEVDLASEAGLFEGLGTTYEEFSGLADAEKMTYIRAYARSRLKEGERLWWLGDEDSEPHTVPLGARLYTRLPMEEKRRVRAEAALLSPRIVAPSRSKGKYDDVALYLATYHGILVHQTRDLFSAGSVALRADPTRGGNYLLRALLDLEDEMRMAAAKLPDELFEEYWGEPCPPPRRLRRWLEIADRLAVGWTPSRELFLDQAR